MSGSEWRDVPRWALLLGVIALAGLALRLYHASGTWLNPDECLEFLHANHASLEETIQDSRRSAHPPLLFVLIHFWRRLGEGELFLRLLSVIPSSLAIVFLGLWVRLIGGAAAGLLAAALFAASPHLAMNGAELRQYSLFLLGLTGALFSLEAAIEKQRAGWMVAFALFQLVAIWTLYSAMWAVAAIGACTLFRLFARPASSRLRLSWVLAEAAGVLSYALLWFSHLRQMLESNRLTGVADSWMAGAYFQPHAQSIAWFTIRSTGALLGYMFSNVWCGALAAILMPAGLAALIRERRYMAAAVLALPWAIVYAGSVLRLAAYGGSRHSLVLLPFLVAAAGIGGSVLARSRSALVVLILLAAAPFWPSWSGAGAQLVPRAEQEQRHMRAMLAKIRELAPPGSILIGDGQARAILAYYLGRTEDTTLVDNGNIQLRDCGGYRVPSGRQWSMTIEDVADLFARLREAIPEPGKQTTLCVSGGWGHPLCVELARRRPDLVRAGPWRFGKNLAVAELARLRGD